ncbi:hypothetical protein V8C86DRAFT_573702 [Haematococcus lacustris]
MAAAPHRPVLPIPIPGPAAAALMSLRPGPGCGEEQREEQAGLSTACGPAACLPSGRPSPHGRGSRGSRGSRGAGAIEAGAAGAASTSPTPALQQQPEPAGWRRHERVSTPGLLPADSPSPHGPASAPPGPPPLPPLPTGTSPGAAARNAFAVLMAGGRAAAGAGAAAGVRVPSGKGGSSSSSSRGEAGGRGGGRGGQARPSTAFPHRYQQNLYLMAMDPLKIDPQQHPDAYVDPLVICIRDK